MCAFREEGGGGGVIGATSQYSEITFNITMELLFIVINNFLLPYMYLVALVVFKKYFYYFFSFAVDENFEC